RSAAEIAELVTSGDRKLRLIRAQDRFGDYGEVGIAVFFAIGNNLIIESLLLSCRVLGKGVEHQVVSMLGREAQGLGATNIVFLFKQTNRNQPAEIFLKSIGATQDCDGSFHLI